MAQIVSGFRIFIYFIVFNNSKKNFIKEITKETSKLEKSKFEYRNCKKKLSTFAVDCFSKKFFLILVQHA